MRHPLRRTSYAYAEAWFPGSRPRRLGLPLADSNTGQPRENALGRRDARNPTATGPLPRAPSHVESPLLRAYEAVAPALGSQGPRLCRAPNEACR